MPLADYLAAEPLVVARLQEKVPSVKAVFVAADADGVAEAKQVTPALHVLFGGYSPTRSQEGSAGKVQESEQTWVVVTAVRNLRTPKTGAAVREEAGPILLAVLAALQGWRPGADHTPFELAAAPRPGYSAGYGYFPLAFTTRVVTRGTD